LFWLLACTGANPDPRPELLKQFAPSVRSTQDPWPALREERPGVACQAFKSQLQASPKEENAWVGLLVASARAPCLSVEEGDRLQAWAATQDLNIWAGARAEWLLHRGDEAGARSLLPAAPPDARLRLAMQLGEGEMAVEAAEAVLLQWPGTLMACRVLVTTAMQKKDLFRAIEEAECNGAKSSDLQRLAGVALDIGGDRAAAEELFRDSRSFVHLAVLLAASPSTPERLQEAVSLLSEDEAPPALLHRSWLFLQGKGPALTEAQIAALQGNPDMSLVKAAVRMDQLSDVELEALSDLPGAAPAVMQARIATLKGNTALAKAALERARQREPYFEPVFRSVVGGMLDLGLDPAPALAWWAGLDPDHIRLRGLEDRREVCWEVVAPWSWKELAERGIKRPDPSGSDEVGQAFRAAMALPDRNSRLDALAEIQHQNTDLLELARIRYQIEAGLLDSSAPLQ
jgi:hypothetical protein